MAVNFASVNAAYKAASRIAGAGGAETTAQTRRRQLRHGTG